MELTAAKAVFTVLAYLALIAGAGAMYSFYFKPRFKKVAPALNLVFTSALGAGFFLALHALNFNIGDFRVCGIKKAAVSLAAAALMYLANTLLLEPVSKRVFKKSSQNYEKKLAEPDLCSIFSFILVCAVSPIFEELLFRGTVLGGLDGRYGEVLALAASTLVFALSHFSLVQTPTALLAGIVLGLLYLKTGTLFAPILAHCAYNTAAFAHKRLKKTADRG